jgi:hypothetical protein
MAMTDERLSTSLKYFNDIISNQVKTSSSLMQFGLGKGKVDQRFYPVGYLYGIKSKRAL